MTKLEYYYLVYKLWEKWRNYDNKEGTSKTWCNYFTAEVCFNMGYNKFFNGHEKIDLTKNFPMMANQMHKVLCEDKSNWIEAGAQGVIAVMKQARDKNIARLIVASQTAEEHGHVCIILYGFVPSGKWSKYVPRCANIGGKNFWNKGVNYAYAREPQYFIYRLKKD